jgi:hypothetical protein
MREDLQTVSEEEIMAISDQLMERNREAYQFLACGVDDPALKAIDEDNEFSEVPAQ